MSKQFINLLGALVAVAVLALGVFVVALPTLLDSFSVGTQTLTVATTNAVYAQQIDDLEDASTRQAEIDATVAALRAQIPASAKLDDVFEIVGSAALYSGVTLVSVTAEDPVPFTPRVDPTIAPTGAAAAEQPATADPTTTAGAAAEVNGGAAATGTDAATDAEAGAAASAPSARQQIPFSITIDATDMGQVTTFLNALRTGPRLLAGVSAVAQSAGTLTEVTIKGLTFYDVEQ